MSRRPLRYVRRGLYAVGVVLTLLGIVQATPLLLLLGLGIVVGTGVGNSLLELRLCARAEQRAKAIRTPGRLR
jgi:hypothetical protein